ncbi:unnamed protein product [Nezara viridula]|uniref:Uncharacterized protein n=1 Tax=Nezara viridula TaxID=85310 RepID=A0A9P0HKZ9_NEZVI|nr:unnamed protein product [Nezara viridula]
MKLKLKKLINFPYVGMGGRRKIFLLLAALCTCEGLLGISLIVLAAKPLSTVTEHLKGLDLLLPTILKAQICYGIFVTFMSVIGISVTRHCIYSYNLYMTVDARIKKPVLPASCCSPYVDIPCIHDFLQQDSLKPQKDISLFLEGVYTSGCIGILLKPMLTSITSFSVIAILICIFQTCELVIANVLYYLCTRKQEDF